MKTKIKITKDEIAKELEIVNREGWTPFFDETAEKYNIDKAILYGIASRECNCDPDLAYCKRFGDKGHGHGIIQIDDRWHKPFLAKYNGKPQPKECIDYGASLLRANLDHYHQNYLNALCAYNAGIGGVNKVLGAGKSPDDATTGGDYGSDVIARASLFRELLAEGK